jgi:hypothetical protein
MGLLDEAIREHLELKRRRGGDPSAIAREEHEALAPGLADALADDGEGATDDGLQESTIDSATAAMPGAGHGEGEDRIAGMSAGGQETAELDMQEVMEQDPDAADPGSPLAPIVDELSPGGSHDGTTHGDDPIDWEYPGERDHESPPEEIPGQERLSFE